MKMMKLVGVLFIASTLSALAQKQVINASQSLVKWTGNKIGGSHNGEIQITSGYFELSNGSIVSGEVVMDMNTLSNLDLEDEGYNQKLIAHLKSDDFFGVEHYPTATFKVTKGSPFKNGTATLTGILTIKGKSENISFDVSKKEDALLAKVKVDRSIYNVRYGSNSFFDNLGDKAIDDIFLLDIQIVF
ncbi:YceI family protein [Carboxylicivirga taeanensis]|uniref:YceI family protein n=1 Tax=Carboxylicivirga taeanensis TaxID=1416875 RepID=UPI003F6DA899